MADTINNKPKLQLRSGLSINGSDKTPSPATKLLISHGKPNFTIQRSPKAEQNGDASPLAQAYNNNNNESAFKNANGTTNGSTNGTTNGLSNGNTNGTTNGNTNGTTNGTTNGESIVLKSTKFNGTINTAKVGPATANSSENEAARVVLRRTLPRPEPVKTAVQEDEDASVPEFIRRQRRIQERLAKENVLDFESRRSGYFTHVMISPTSASRTSFMETMASPAIVPSLEIPPPQKEVEQVAQVKQQEEVTVTNGQTAAKEEERKEEEAAIEEVNKAVAGEEDDEKQPELEAEVSAVTISHTNGDAAAIEEHVSGALCVNGEGKAVVEDAVQVVPEGTVAVESVSGVNAANIETTEHASGALIVQEAEEKKEEVEVKSEELKKEELQTAEVTKQSEEDIKVHASGALIANAPASSELPTLGEDAVKIVVTAEAPVVELPNGIAVSSIEATTHASGALVTNAEDVQKTEAEPKPVDPVAAELEAMAKLKFEIKADDATNVEVTPVLRTE